MDFTLTSLRALDQISTELMLVLSGTLVLIDTNMDLMRKEIKSLYESIAHNQMLDVGSSAPG